jgi:hypothetical protein
LAHRQDGLTHVSQVARCFCAVHILLLVVIGAWRVHATKPGTCSSKQWQCPCRICRMRRTMQPSGAGWLQSQTDHRRAPQHRWRLALHELSNNSSSSRTASLPHPPHRAAGSCPSSTVMSLRRVLGPAGQSQKRHGGLVAAAAHVRATSLGLLLRELCCASTSGHWNLPKTARYVLDVVGGGDVCADPSSNAIWQMRGGVCHGCRVC